MNKHRYLRIIFALLIISAFLLGCDNRTANEKLIENAARIHEEALTIDTHLDTPIHLQRDSSFALDELHDGRERKNGKVDFPRMSVGGIDAGFFIVWTSQGERNAEAYKSVKEEALTILEVIKSNVEKYPNFAELAYSSKDVERIVDDGKHAILIGMENGYPIGMDISLVEEFYDLGIRYITLCHYEDNDICDASTDKSNDEGLSDFGIEVVKQMNRLGILVDVSHISDHSFYDVIKTTRVPIFASHSNARSLCDHPRNMTDDMIRHLAANGGVIHINLVDEYVKTPPPNPQRDSAIVELKKSYGNYSDLAKKEREAVHEKYSEIRKKFPQPRATLEDAIDHIDHIVNLVGIDHVGIGSDFDGGGGVDGVHDISEMGNITLELLRRGYSEEDIKKIWGGNFMRVFKEVERFSRK